MSSERQIAANRANGALSEGPVTPEGKRRSSRNAVKSGIYTNAVLINGESPELYEETRLHYFNRFKPADKVEEHLVDQLVACRWRMDRMAALEAASVDHQMDCQQAEIDETFESIDPATRAAIAFRSLGDVTRALETFRRFESALARQYDRAYSHLESLQKRKFDNDPNPKNEQ